MSTATPAAPVPRLSYADLPALHAAADSASLAAQRSYLRLVRLELVLLVLGAAATSVSVADPRAARALAGAGGFLLVLSLIVTLGIRAAKHEGGWYGGRAVAESVKTLAWKYATCAEPFTAALPLDEARHAFGARLRAVLEQAARLSVPLLAEAPQTVQITPAMDQLRAAGLDERKAVYLRDRIHDQQGWYLGKARISGRRQKQLFALIAVAQLAAVAFSFLAMFGVVQRVSLASSCSALAAALIAWLQLRRHQEQAQSYALAAQELGLIEIEAAQVSTEACFSEFVSDAEAAISREHTLWVARRDAALAPLPQPRAR
jgi:hypothetical protein